LDRVILRRNQEKSHKRETADAFMRSFVHCRFLVCHGHPCSLRSKCEPGGHQQPVLGTHSKASSPFNPTPADPRIGVANQGLLLEEQGRIEEGDPAEGGMGNHAIFVGSIAGSITPTGEPIVCDGTAGNPGPAVP
jgi:hypothetical protein